MKRNFLKKEISILLSLAMAISPVGSVYAEEAVSAENSDYEAEALFEESVEEETAEQVSGVEESVSEEITDSSELLEDDTVSEDSVEEGGAITAGGGFETLYAVVSGIKDADVTGVSYSGTMEGALAGDDLTYLVRDVDGSVRVDIPGIKAGTYSIKITTASNEYKQDGITVNAYDRSGYAHFNYSGVGAYNDDGTLKANAKVLYVTPDNMNTVTVVSKDGTSVTGIGNILNSNGMESSGGKASNGGAANTNKGIIKKLAEDGTPLDVRFVGCISESGLNKPAAYSAADAGKIDGLTKYDSADFGGTEGDNGHMARMKSGKDVTLEGIGTDATIDGWGFHYIAESSAPTLGKSFEVRNLTFINTPEDAVGMEGQQASKNASSDLSASVEHCWIHNNEFYGPEIANPAESDKSEGDGSCDFKRGQYLTVDYNYFQGCHKTNLVGSADYSLQFNLTYHHNYWYLCKARGPLTRRANVHMYNNVFWGQTDYAMNTRADAYIFSESNLFLMCKSPQAVEAGAIKSYNDSFGAYLQNKGTLGTIVQDKSESVPNNCRFSARGIDYSSFDTNSTLSYIPAGKYDLQEDLVQMRKTVEAYVGVQKESFVEPSMVSMSDVSFINRFASSAVKANIPDTLTVGKISKTLYAFEVQDACIAKVSVGAASAYSGVVIDEAGVEYATVPAGQTVSVYLPAKGKYAVEPQLFQPGDSKKVTIGTFKEMVIDSIAIEAKPAGYDPLAMTSLDMSQTSAVLLTGNTVSLSAKRIPARNSSTAETVWTSSNDKVASVSSKGVVTAVSVGEAVITATVGSFTTTCKVKVSDPVAVEGVALDAASLNIAVGKSADLDAVSDPVDTTDMYEISFESANTDIAAVDGNGKVTGKSVGKTTITAKLTILIEDGDSATGYAPGETYTSVCQVNVIEGATLPASDTSINFSTDSLDAKSFFTFPGKKNLKSVTGSYGGTSFTKSLKMESSTEVDFTASAEGKLLIVMDNAKPDLKITDSKGERVLNAVDNVIETTVAAGKVSIVRGSGENHIFYISYTSSKNTEDGAVEITGISVNKKSLSIVGLGKTDTLSAAVAPDNTTRSKLVNWVSSDPTVAIVDGTGKVTATGAGKAVISAVSAWDNTITDECEVTVTSSPDDVIPITGISISRSSYTMEDLGETVKLSAAVKPSKTTETNKNIVWSSSNDKVATVADGVVTGVATGDAVITAALQSNPAISAACVITVKDSTIKDVKYDFDAAKFLTDVGAFTNTDKYGALNTGGKGLANAYTATEPASSGIYGFDGWKIPSKQTETIAIVKATGKIVFTAPSAGTLTFVGRSSGSDVTGYLAIKPKDGDAVEVGKLSGSSYTTLTYKLPAAGEYELIYSSKTESTGEIRIKSISVEGQEKTNPSATATATATKADATATATATKADATATATQGAEPTATATATATQAVPTGTATQAVPTGTATDKNIYQEAHEKGQGYVSENAIVKSVGKNSTVEYIDKSVSVNTITVMKGNKLTITDGAAKSFVSADKKLVAVNKKGVISAKKATDAIAKDGIAINYTSATGGKKVLYVKVIEPQVSAVSGNMLIKNPAKPNIQIKAGSDFDAAVKLPLNAQYDASKLKNKGACTALDVPRLGMDGKWHISGKAGLKGSATVPFIVNGKKVNVKLVIKK